MVAGFVGTSKTSVWYRKDAMPPEAVGLIRRRGAEFVCRANNTRLNEVSGGHRSIRPDIQLARIMLNWSHPGTSYVQQWTVYLPVSPLPRPVSACWVTVRGGSSDPPDLVLERPTFSFETLISLMVGTDRGYQELLNNGRGVFAQVLVAAALPVACGRDGKKWGGGEGAPWYVLRRFFNSDPIVPFRNQARDIFL